MLISLQVNSFLEIKQHFVGIFYVTMIAVVINREIKCFSVGTLIITTTLKYVYIRKQNFSRNFL